MTEQELEVKKTYARRSINFVKRKIVKNGYYTNAGQTERTMYVKYLKKFNLSKLDTDRLLKYMDNLIAQLK